MDEVLKLIGSIFISIIIIAIPMVCMAAFVFEWPEIIQFSCAVVTLCEYFLLLGVIYIEVGHEVIF